MSRGLPIGAVSVVGVMLFAWPFVGADLPASTPAWTLTLACIGGLKFCRASAKPFGGG